MRRSLGNIRGGREASGGEVPGSPWCTGRRTKPARACDRSPRTQRGCALGLLCNSDGAHDPVCAHVSARSEGKPGAREATSSHAERGVEEAAARADRRGAERWKGTWQRPSGLVLRGRGGVACGRRSSGRPKAGSIGSTCRRTSPLARAEGPSGTGRESAPRAGGLGHIGPWMNSGNLRDPEARRRG